MAKTKMLTEKSVPQSLKHLIYSQVYFLLLLSFTLLSIHAICNTWNFLNTYALSRFQNAASACDSKCFVFYSHPVSVRLNEPVFRKSPCIFLLTILIAILVSHCSSSDTPGGFLPQNPQFCLESLPPKYLPQLCQVSNATVSPKPTLITSLKL